MRTPYNAAAEAREGHPAAAGDCRLSPHSGAAAAAVLQQARPYSLKAPPPRLSNFDWIEKGYNSAFNLSPLDVSELAPPPMSRACPASSTLAYSWVSVIVGVGALGVF